MTRAKKTFFYIKNQSKIFFGNVFVILVETSIYSLYFFKLLEELCMRPIVQPIFFFGTAVFFSNSFFRYLHTCHSIKTLGYIKRGNNTVCTVTCITIAKYGAIYLKSILSLLCGLWTPGKWYYSTQLGIAKLLDFQNSVVDFRQGAQ